jgi:DNA (cytosine-5)-methyltransferase 1
MTFSIRISWLSSPHNRRSTCIARLRRSGGQDDTKNKELSKTFVAAIKLLRPRTASFENVPGMLNEPHVSYAKEILRELLLEGYQVRLCLLKSSDYGVPQTRRRLFILASQQGCLFPSRPTTTSRLTVSNAIQDMEGVQPMPGSGTVKLPNGRWISHHNSEGTEARKGAIHLSKYKDGYAPALLTSKPVKHYSSLLNRLLTPRERARLQTFPDDYEFSGTVDEVKEQIGNAVPCSLARCVGHSLMECHRKEPVWSNPN